MKKILPAILLPVLLLSSPFFSSAQSRVYDVPDSLVKTGTRTNRDFTINAGKIPLGKTKKFYAPIHSQPSMYSATTVYNSEAYKFGKKGPSDYVSPSGVNNSYLYLKDGNIVNVVEESSRKVSITVSGNKLGDFSERVSVATNNGAYFYTVNGTIVDNESQH